MLDMRQAMALKKLADAYQELSDVWDSSGGPNDWEGPESFGGVLDSAGVLPTISLDEAAFELESLYQESMIALNAIDIIRDTFHGSTQYESQDEKYFYFSTTYKNTIDHAHRVAKENGEYRFRFLTGDADWLEDDQLTKAIQKEQAKLFPPITNLESQEGKAND